MFLNDREPMVDMGRRDSASAFSAAAARCVASLLACCAGKRFAFPQLRTLAGSNPSAFSRKSAPGPYGPGALCSKGLGRRDSNPQQPAPKTGVLPLNYVPMCGVARATRLVYLICEGIANAIEQAYGERLGVACGEGAVVARHAREFDANACRFLLGGDIGGADALGQVVALG